MSSRVVKINEDQFASFMTCPLCDNLYEEATTINECLHTFCKKCIYSKISDEDLEHCPVCEIDLGPNAQRKLRPDISWENIRVKSFPKDIKGVDKPHKISSTVTAMNAELSLLATAPPPERSSSMAGGRRRKVLEEGGSKRKDSRRGGRTHHEKKKAHSEPSNPSESMVSGGTGTAQKREAPVQATDHSSQVVSDQSEGVCFSLFACEEQEGRSTLPQIPSPYLRLGNGTATVSNIQQYVIKKLELSSEAEIEIQCMGRPLNPALTVNDLLRQWLLQNRPFERFSVTSGSSGEEFMMKLGYIRKVTVHPSLACLQEYGDDDI